MEEYEYVNKMCLSNIIGGLVNGICHQSDMLETLLMLLESLELKGYADILSDIIEDVDLSIKELERLNSKINQDILNDFFGIDDFSLREMPEFKNLMERIEQIDF